MLVANARERNEAIKAADGIRKVAYYGNVLVTSDLCPINSFIEAVRVEIMRIFTRGTLPVPTTFTAIRARLIRCLRVLLNDRRLERAVCIDPACINVM